MRSRQDLAEQFTNNFNFHDSEIPTIEMSFTNGRSCEIIIDYYNWEDNDEDDNWNWRKLKITFGYVAVFEWNSPDYINDFVTRTILEVNYNKQINDFKRIEDDKTSRIRGYKSVIDRGDNYLDIEFVLCSFEDGINDDVGYLRVIGTDVDYEGDDTEREGKIHISVDD